MYQLHVSTNIELKHLNMCRFMLHILLSYLKHGFLIFLYIDAVSIIFRAYGYTIVQYVYCPINSKQPAGSVLPTLSNTQVSMRWCLWKTSELDENFSMGNSWQI